MGGGGGARGGIILRSRPYTNGLKQQIIFSKNWTFTPTQQLGRGEYITFYVNIVHENLNTSVIN